MNLLSKWNVLAIALVAMMSVGLTSCDNDKEKDVPEDEPDQYEVAYTRWAYSISYGDGVSESIEMSFTTSNATVTHVQKVDNQSLSETYNYSYKREKYSNFIVLNPMESGRPILEAEIVNASKMVIKNTYNGATMDFYKQ